MAFEVAAGAACAGARAIVTMKHVGLNVAADPLMTLSYMGVEGRLRGRSSPTTRACTPRRTSRTPGTYARFAKVPMLEPSDSQEAKDFLKLGIEISRTIQHARDPAHDHAGEPLAQPGDAGRARGPNPRDDRLREESAAVRADSAVGPGHAAKVEERLGELRQAPVQSPANRIEWRDRSLGIITASIAYQYVREVWPEASVLKLGLSYPFPDDLIRQFAAGVKTRAGRRGTGRLPRRAHQGAGHRLRRPERSCPNIGELSVADAAGQPREDGRPRQSRPPSRRHMPTNLPARPPVLCPGCPHRGVFYALGKHDVVVTGDIGCYSLGAFKPLNRMDTILCMGGGISMAHGMDKAGEKRKVVGIVGDSTFFHSGITGLLDIAYNKGARRSSSSITARPR